MVRYLKSGKSREEKENANQKIKETVENILKKIEKGGDGAVRELSIQFDDYNPNSFKLTKVEIEELVDSLTERELSDIKATMKSQINAVLSAWFGETDWYFIRELDTGKEVPADIVK